MKQDEEIISENNESAEKVSDQTSVNTPDEISVEKLQSELAEQKEKFIRLYSEFENFRRRTAKEKLELIQSANEQLIKTLLPVIDDFDRAEKSFRDKNEKENDKELEGFFLIHSKFKKILEQAGVKMMDVKAGSDFNADLHEAITQIPTPDETLKGKVVDVIEPAIY